MDIKEQYNNEAKIYERTTRQVNLYYDEALDLFSDLLPKDIDSVLDVCCGTGILTKRIIDTLKLNKNNKIVGIDFSSGMLSVADSRFEENLVDFHCRDILEDFSDIGTDFDLVVSSYGIHNIHGYESKLIALKHVFNCLKSGGYYYTCDIIRGINEKEQSEFDELQYNKLLESFNKQEADEWMNLLREEDDPETLENNIKLLNEAGFCDVQMIWRRNSLAIWCGRKK